MIRPRSARLPRRSGAIANRSLTRARASNTPVNSSSVRKVRRRNSGDFAMGATEANFGRRKVRVRKTVRRAANGRPRLSVFRSSKHIYAQVIDDANNHTVASASSLEKDMAGKLKTGGDKDAATEVGKLV